MYIMFVGSTKVHNKSQALAKAHSLPGKACGRTQWLKIENLSRHEKRWPASGPYFRKMKLNYFIIDGN